MLPVASLFPHDYSPDPSVNAVCPWTGCHQYSGLSSTCTLLEKVSILWDGRCISNWPLKPERADCSSKLFWRHQSRQSSTIRMIMDFGFSPAISTCIISSLPFLIKSKNISMRVASVFVGWWGRNTHSNSSNGSVVLESHWAIIAKGCGFWLHM